MVSRMACFPWTCWAASGEDGLDEDRWVELERIAARCLECVDLELTSGLFDFMKVMRASGQEREGYAFVNMALNEASVHAELASIPAECRHSKVQNTSQSNRRGRRRAARRIGAESFVNSIVGEWQHVAEHIDAETLPARRTTQAILQSICTTRSKKDKEAFGQAAASGQGLHSRLREYFRKRSKSREISAWNAFQAYHQQGQAFIGEGWGADVADLATEWRGIKGTEAEQEWIVRAAELNAALAKLVQQPLPVREGREGDLPLP